MDEACRAQILSNDFGDILVEYTGDIETIKQRFQSECFHKINEKFAVVHIPVSKLTAFNEFYYYAVPSLLGLMDTSSLEASGVNRIQNIPNFSLKGQGTIIGIVDTGIEYTHQAFKREDNTSKILTIWDQTIQTDKFPADMHFGTEYNRDQINEAIKNANPLSVVPSTDENGHGTYLAGIAAGNKNDEKNFSGVVPDAEIAIVKLKQAKPHIRDFFAVPQDVIAFQENDIMHGVQYLVDFARSQKKPIAICIGLGSGLGSHDGRSSLSSFLSDVGDEVGITIVVAAGNEGNSGHHYYGEIDRAVGFDTVEVRVAEKVQGFTLEIWGVSPNTYSIDILSPTGEYIPRIPARIGESRNIGFVFEETKIAVDYNLVEAKTGDELILLRFKNPTSGIWKFKVYGSGDVNLFFHSWLPSTEFLSTETYFIKSNPETTITDPGNASIPITTTAYNHNTQSIYQNSSRGYTRDNQVKPDLAAPGVDIIGPGLNNTYTTRSGTSVAAAHTAGIAAMMLEWGIVKNNFPSMDGFEVKRYLTRGAKRSPNNLYPNKEWGYGIVDIYNTFESLRTGVE